MDTFDELIGEGKMEYEPSPNFTDRVMGEINNDSSNVPKKNKSMYGLLAIAASIIVIIAAFGFLALNSHGSSDKHTNVAINTSTTAPATTATTAPSNSDNAALADQFDSAISSTSKDLSNDISSNPIDSSDLNDTDS